MHWYGDREMSEIIIRLPDWLVLLIAFALMLSVVNSILGIMLHRLKRKIIHRNKEKT